MIFLLFYRSVRVNSRHSSRERDWEGRKADIKRFVTLRLRLDEWILRTGNKVSAVIMKNISDHCFCFSLLQFIVRLKPIICFNLFIISSTNQWIDFFKMLENSEKCFKYFQLQFPERKLDAWPEAGSSKCLECELETADQLSKEMLINQELKK